VASVKKNVPPGRKECRSSGVEKFVTDAGVRA
jgi:hypothetical protein